MNSIDAHQQHKEFLFPCVSNYYESPLVLVKAKGCTAIDIEGREYLDFFGGILTVSLEHCHEEVNNAVESQLRSLGHVSTLYQNLPQLEVAKQLSEIAPGKLKKSFFTNSGTEANETAIVLAKIFTKRSEIIVLRHSYAGRGHLALNTTGHAPWRALESSMPGIKHAHAPYCYRCPFGMTYPSCNLRCATDLEELIQTETSGQIAAFMAEPILGVGGFIVPPDDYFQVAVGIARNYGGVFVCDEVQTAFGRTGDKWFGIEHSNVEPDIMTMAKGIANGFPVGATIATEEIANTFTKPSICTFGGNPISMSAAASTLAVMARENVPKLAKEKGQIIKNTIDEIFERYSIVGDVRGRGLMWGLELVSDRKTKTPAPKMALKVLEASKSLGLLLGKGGLYGNVIRMAPPMLIEKRDLEIGCDLLVRAFEKVCGASGGSTNGC